MTVPATARRAGPFNGNGVTTSFPFTFKVFATSDISVTLADSDGLETTLVLSSDYTVTLNGDQDTSPGGSVTYPASGSPLPAGSTLTIVTAVPYDQTLDLPGGGAFSPRALENALDRTVIQVQQIAEEVGRALVLPVSSTADPVLPVPEANKIIGWNDTASGLVNRDITDLATAVAYANWTTDVFSGTGTTDSFTLTVDPGSVHNCDVSIGGVTQKALVDFTLSGRTLTFTDPPPAGTDNVAVRYGQALPVGTTPTATTNFRVDKFTGTGAQTAFTLTAEVLGEDYVTVAVGGVVYTPGYDFTVSGTTLTFLTAPPAPGDGEPNIAVRYGREVSADVADAANVSYTAPAGDAQSQYAVNARILTPYDYGAIGNNVADDTAAFDRWIAACTTGQVRGHIPEGMFVLSDKLTIPSSFELTCDTSASMRWTTTDAATCGVLLDFGNGGDTLVSMAFPQMFSGAINSSFQIPGYSSVDGWDYDLSSRVGSAVDVRGGDRISLYVHYAKGWNDAVKVTPTTTKTSDNYDIRVGVADFCLTGLHIANAGPGSLGIAQMCFKANTIWAKFPIYIDTTNGYVISSRFEIDGVFVNENGGCVIYGVGTGVRGSTFRVNWADAGRRADSVPATTVGLICPYLGGNQSSNGVSFDGMGTSPNIAYWGGQHCDISVGAAFDYIGSDLGGGSPVPAAGHTIRIRNAGRNDVRVLYAENESSLTNTPILASATIGEANYNSGVGGAQFSRSVYCSATLTALAAGATATRYVYHQLVGVGGFRPVLVAHKNSATITNQLQIEAFVTGTTNREIEVVIRNNGASPYTGTIFFFLVIQ